VCHKVTNREIEGEKERGIERAKEREREREVVDFLLIPKIVNLDARVLLNGVVPTCVMFIFAIPWSPSSSSRLRSGD
jgi:hypothetical protein